MLGPWVDLGSAPGDADNWRSSRDQTCARGQRPRAPVAPCPARELCASRLPSRWVRSEPLLTCSPPTPGFPISLSCFFSLWRPHHHRSVDTTSFFCSLSPDNKKVPEGGFLNFTAVFSVSRIDLAHGGFVFFVEGSVFQAHFLRPSWGPAWVLPGFPRVQDINRRKGHRGRGALWTRWKKPDSWNQTDPGSKPSIAACDTQWARTHHFTLEGVTRENTRYPVKCDFGLPGRSASRARKVETTCQSPLGKVGTVEEGRRP